MTRSAITRTNEELHNNSIYVVVLVTSELLSNDISAVTSEAQDMERRGIELYVVGMLISFNNLKVYVTHSKERNFK